MSVFFHGNFGLNRQRMAEIALAASNDPSRSDAALAKPFGYGAPFAATYRSWLHKTGIGVRGRPFRLTDFGRTVLEHDPSFSASETMWLMHHQLTIDPVRAEAWHFFMEEFRPGNPEFDKDDLKTALMMKLRSHSEEHFGPMSKMNPIIVRKLIECYVAHEALGDLGLLRKTGKDSFAFGDAKVIGPWKTAEEFSAAY